MARSFKPYGRSRAPAPPGGQSEPLPQAPLGGTRGEAMRRLQMGAIGVVAVLLLIGLASIIKDRAAQTENTSVVGAAATSSPGAETAVADPLAEAGVVPDIPANANANANADADAAAAQNPGAAGARATPAPGVR